MSVYDNINIYERNAKKLIKSKKYYGIIFYLNFVTPWLQDE